MDQSGSDLSVFLLRDATSSLLRDADLFAALTQESRGDQCAAADAARLSAMRERFMGVPATVGPGSELTPLARRVAQFPDEIKGAAKAAIAAALSRTAALLENARVVAIIRAQNPDAAIARGVELVEELGCLALEVTTDTVEFPRVLRELVRRCGAKAAVGVGTVMQAKDVSWIAALGATFMLSPVNPPGFVEACTRHGVVSLPAACTPNEVWTAHLQGATFVELFPAMSVALRHSSTNRH